MTVPTTTARRVIKANGVSTVFSTDFVFLDADTLLVTIDEGDGDQIVKELNVDYTVTGGGGNLGSVVFNAAPAAGHLVIIERVEPYVQELNLLGGDPFNAKSVMGGFDRVVMMIQQLLDITKQAILGPKSRDPNLPPLRMPAPEAHKFLRGLFDETGWENVDIEDALAGIDPDLLAIPVAVSKGGTGQTTAASMLRANYLDTTGDGGAYAATSVPPTSSLVDGLLVRIRANHTSDSQPTFNLDETGDKNILDAHGNSLPNGGLQQDGVYELSYDAEEDAWLLTGHTRPYVSKLSAVRVITSSQNWTKPANLDYIEVEVVGGGGGSGGCAATAARQAAASGGGGGGEYAYKRIAAASLNATEAVTVGAAGAAGAPGANDGGDGGNTLFGSHVTAAGGKGGKGSAATTGPGVTHNLGGNGGSGGSGGNYHIAGSPGAAGILVSDESSGSNHTRRITSLGYGGAAGGPLGGGGGQAGSSAAGSPGGSYGGGGGGSSVAGADGEAKAGAAGSAGVCVVKEYTFEFV